MAARWAHNPKVAGSSPAPATIAKQGYFQPCFFMQKNKRCLFACFALYHTNLCYRKSSRGPQSNKKIVFGHRWAFHFFCGRLDQAFVRALKLRYSVKLIVENAWQQIGLDFGDKTQQTGSSLRCLMNGSDWCVLAQKMNQGAVS